MSGSASCRALTEASVRSVRWAEEGGDKFASASDAELVEYGSQMFLHRICGDESSFTICLVERPLQSA